jgi:hypothetical protein
MKAHYMQYIVDLYGDAPYFEAFKDNKYNTTGFIDDAVIYKELVKELEARAQLLVLHLLQKVLLLILFWWKYG